MSNFDSLSFKSKFPITELLNYVFQPEKKNHITDNTDLHFNVNVISRKEARRQAVSAPRPTQSSVSWLLLIYEVDLLKNLTPKTPKSMSISVKFKSKSL